MLKDDDRAEVEDIVRAELLASVPQLFTRQFLPYLGPGRNSTGRVPCCILLHTTDFTTANNTVYILGTTAPTTAVFETEVLDTGTVGGPMHDASAIGRIAIRDAGVYDVCWGLQYAASAAAGPRLARLLKNGVQPIDGDRWVSAIDANGTPTPSGSTKLQLAAGDYLEVAAFQLSGGNLNVINAWFSVVLVANV